MKKLFLTFAWMFFGVGLFMTAVAGYQVFYAPKSPETAFTFHIPTLLASKEETTTDTSFTAEKVKGVESVVESEDSRAIIVSRFLERYDSPLKPYDHYGQILVDIADKYNLDFRLLPAIAMQESNLCKAYPEETYNCLGFGIHERGTLGFNSYEQGFERAAMEIKERYVDIGLTTPEQIMTKYTPSSQGSWAESVNQWMAEMRYDDRESGIKLKTNADVLEFVEEEPVESLEELIEK